MQITKKIRILAILAIVLCNIGCDQFSKSMIREAVAPYENIKVLKDHLTVTHVENSGAFLSTGDSLPPIFKFIFLLLLPVIFLSYGLFYLISTAKIPKLYIVGGSFVVGGGIGNLFDRLVHGAVTDFLHIDFVLFQTGIFNLADVSIMAGIGMILVQIITRKTTSANPNLDAIK